MFRTANEDIDRTMVRFLKAMDRKQPVTISYTKADGSRTVRTIEVYDVQVTKAGDFVAKAMDRESGEARQFRLDRIDTYTIHRGAAYRLPEPAPVNDLGIRVTVNQPTAEARQAAVEDRDYWSDRYGYEPDDDYDVAA